MADDFELTFLGTGTSVGVPVIGCGCPVCTSTDPRNTRTRSSVHVRAGGISLLVDSGPDLREQALREKLTRLDAVLYTHGHVDHVVGFDELRAFCWRRETPLPMHGSTETLATLRTMFGWAFAAANTYRGYVKPGPIELDGPFTYGDLKITPVPVEHGSVTCHGFLFQYPGHPAIAYIPDAKHIHPESMAQLRGVGVLIIDALRPTGHPTHMSTGEALETAAALGAERTYLTHLTCDNDHATLQAELPPGTFVAYDGLRI